MAWDILFLFILFFLSVADKAKCGFYACKDSFFTFIIQRLEKDIVSFSGVVGCFGLLI